MTMKTHTYGNVKRLPDNKHAGFGPDYVSDREGPLWITYVADCFDPPVYAFRCADIDEAYEHASIVLCPEIDPDDYAETVQGATSAEDHWDRLEEAGWSMCEDNTWRNTENLQLYEFQPRQGDTQ